MTSRNQRENTNTRWKKKCRNKLELYTRIQRWYEVSSCYDSQSPLLISEGLFTLVLWRSVSHALLQHFRPYPFPPSFSSRFCMIEFSTCSSLRKENWTTVFRIHSHWECDAIAFGIGLPEDRDRVVHRRLRRKCCRYANCFHRGLCRAFG